MLHGCLHEDATWENRHALRWSSVAKQPGVRLEWGSPRGPGTNTIMSKVVLNHKLVSSQLESPPSRWRTNVRLRS